jgi:hypothetical protein
MQNPIVALSIPGLGAEPASAAPSVEPGESSFSDAFADAASATEVEARPEDAPSADTGVQFTWPLIISQKSALLSATGTGVHTANGRLADATVSVEASVPQVLSDDTHFGSALALVPEPDAATVTVSDNAQTEKSQSGLAGFPYGTATEFEEGLSPGMSELGPVEADTNVDQSAYSASQSPLVAAASNPQTKVDKAASKGAALIPWEAAKNDAEAVLAQISDDPASIGVWSEPAMGAKVPLTEILDQPEVPPHSLDRLPIESAYGGIRVGLEERANVGLKPLIWEMGPADMSGAEMRTGGDSPDRPLNVAGADLALDASAAKPSEQESLPAQDADVYRRTSFGGFWERFFSDPFISAPDSGRKTADGMFQSVTVPISGSAMSFALVKTSDEADVKPSRSEPTASVSFTRRLPDSQDILTPLTLVTAPTAANAEVFGKASADLVVSGWVEDLSQSGQGADFLQPFGQAHSARGAAGSPTSAVPVLPVQQIASQLASVLVSNANNMTELALAPEELGRVRLRMEPDAANPDRLLILISVERPETLDLFRRHAGELAEAIRSAGYSGADIGFGQEARDGGSEQKRESPHTGLDLPFEEGSHVEETRMLPTGASLDLRL